MNEEIKRIDQDARRALRWANRLFARVGKLEKTVAAQAQQLKDAEKVTSNLEDITYRRLQTLSKSVESLIQKSIL
jgi:hypothetical protein